MTSGHCLCTSKENVNVEDEVRFCLEPNEDDKNPANQHVPYPTAGAGKPIEEMYKARDRATTKDFNEIVLKIGSKDHTTAIKIEVEKSLVMHTDFYKYYDVGIVVTANAINMLPTWETYPNQYVNPICLPKR